MTGIAIYDPRRLGEEDFLAGFTARQELLEFLLRQLRNMGIEGEAGHRVAIGQRGMGKTSLLRRVAIGIARDPTLARTLLPLTFREEQYNVRSLDHFWRNCAEALADWLERSGDGEAADLLDRELRGPAWRGADEAADAFLDRAARTGRRPVLLVDNLDLVLDALPAEQHWKLRRILQSRRGPIVYAASSRFPRQIGDPQAAFYEFFRIDMLDPLNEREALLCMERLAAARGEAGTPVMEIVRREPQRLRVLHALADGNPRILALLYQLLERTESDTAFDDLEVLLDQLTPYYKARVEELRTELQRSILDAIALNWDPITSHDLSVATGVEVTTVSSQLSRLKNLGLVAEVETSGSRAGYQLAERFFNVWYLMRHGTRRTRQKMQWLTAFLQEFYTAEDLKLMRGHAARDPASGDQGTPYADVRDADALDAAAEDGGRAGLAEAAASFAAPSSPRVPDAARELAEDNFGAAARHLGDVLDLGGSGPFPTDDLLYLLGLFEARGYGERLIAWFEQTGRSDRHAPLHAAFVAHVRGDRTLLDVNPEVRRTAERLHARLAGRRSGARPAPSRGKRRGRPRRQPG
ncbi:winged helix-turn-helix domain-containing protein [Arenibaculum sp.]|jgi:DNA-binding transcriptional ArsR family regulator|uniref:winged helix-turn-helix domain-containing protein n=1 Tax=Arenibaculum sp. TaxID=2865862 RepID=UPI002E119A5B|nr:winged helix-turn-helix domain-containing protein [Arenibaculum sp.]